MQPTGRTVGEGSNFTFTVTALGTSPAFQWYKGSGQITGATNDSYTIHNVQFSDMADYSVVVSNMFNSVTSQVATLTVQRYPPEITVQPTNLSVAVTKDALFSVGATGTTLTYQWLRDGTNLLDATASELVITNVSFADEAGYQVIIANSLGSVTSIVATLTVGYPPVIVTQPTNQAVPVGSNALFTVEVSGTEPLSCQWRKGESALPGQTGTALQLNAGRRAPTRTPTPWWSTVRSALPPASWPRSPSNSRRRLPSTPWADSGRSGATSPSASPLPARNRWPTSGERTARTCRARRPPVTSPITSPWRMPGPTPPWSATFWAAPPAASPLSP